MMVDIELPNGAILEDAPDDATDEEIKIEAIRLGLATESDFKEKTPEKVYDPTEGMNTFEKVAAGLGKSVYDTGRGIGQLMGLVDQEEIDAANRRDQALMDTGAGMAGNILGHGAQFAIPGGAIAGTGKLASKVPGMTNLGKKTLNLGKALMNPTTKTTAIGSGALYAGLQPGDIKDRAFNTALGGGGGLLGYGAAKTLGNMVAPKKSGSAAMLREGGTDITPGMTLGPAAKRVEDSMTSVPLFGDAIKKGQADAIKSFNRATWNKVLEPIKKKVPDDIPEGREMVDWSYNALHDYYQNLLPKMSVTVDDEFMRGMTSLRELAGVDTLPDKIQIQFEDIIQKEVWGRLTKSGKGSGETLKMIESNLGALGRAYKNAMNPDQKQLGRAIQEAQRLFRNLVYRNNPKYKDQLKAVNKSWAMSDRVGKATEMAGTDQGVFTGAQLLSAVRNRTPGRDKFDFRRGKALLQPWAEAGKDVLGQTVPDSGTPIRAANLLALGGAMYDPVTTGLLSMGAGAYATKPGQRMMRGLLTARPDSLMPLGEGIRSLAPYMAPLGTGGLLQVNQ